MNAGGDVAIGAPRIGGRPWEIGVSNPFDPGTDFAILHVTHGGVASSGKDRRHWSRNGFFNHHIIDPFTGLPAASDVLRATIVTTSVIEAEAAAKAALILGSGRGMDWIEADPSLAGLFILDNGDILYSRRIQSYL